ncbi:MAG: ribonuclease H family protein [Bacteroidales bacterium]|nr:ribonuclease H family protein [Bacteroidales bacterium]
MGKTKKYYVVWTGRKSGIFTSWDECKASIDGFPQARYKSFETKKDAVNAFENPYYDYFKISNEKQTEKPPDKQNIYTLTRSKILNTGNNSELLTNQLPIIDSLCVDAACSGNPGCMEYRGVHILTGKQIFYYKYPFGTNNIGEFLGIVHGLSYLKRHNLPQPLYTDSVNAMKWVRQKQCKTKLEITEKTKELFEYIKRAEYWLQHNTYTTQILKWNTESWGEIPADFGRKK